ncbi:hypothetical protein R4P64_29020 [Rhodococcus sp. IEGM 1366]|uniref:hypothetical protein n=1 Tax=Rhodococcus sp. IEGM 1366 TaxID=3082223 RepID=UPI002952CB4F|nr:hypothetical protein [Rhodococcus sp. IEGM 1366]MDV8070583.1 hypothetical protein [Rhodococcus sp. IEGM 1366]
MPTPARKATDMRRLRRSTTAIAVLLALSGCAATDDSRDGLQPIPTRTTPASTATQASSPEASDVVTVTDFTILPTFGCLEAVPARSIVTVGWSASAATEVSLSLDGQVLPVGIQNELPYQVPAGGPTGIGAAVVFACDGQTQHTIDVTWTGHPLAATTRTVTIVKEPGNG